MRIVPFLADSEDGELVIFRIEDENEPDAYIWVDNESGKIQITSFYRLPSYFNHAVEPMIVASKVNPDAIHDAFVQIEKYPRDELQKMFDEHNREMENRKKNEKSWKEYCDWEEESLKMAEEAEKGDGKVMF